MTVPQATIDLYQSGLKDHAQTVSSFFDIRARQYTYHSENDVLNGKAYPVDIFRMLQPMVLETNIFPVQGLIVDMQEGGIGFRNHTLPTGISQGAEWSEDLLWMEPMTECVNTNLTIEFKLGDGTGLGSGNMQNVTIIDNGGFANLIQDYPEFSMDNNQNDPQLRNRAYKAAWLTNVYGMLTMNITRPAPHAFAYLNSTVGQRWPLDDSGTGIASLEGIYVDPLFTSLVNPSSNTLTTTNSSFTNSTYTSGVYTNPFNITQDNYTTVTTLCQGVGGADYANSSNIFVQCGLFYSAAVRKDGVQSLIFYPNTTWQQSVYACASTTKVSIKEVAMRYNASLGADLKSLEILNVTAKEYKSDKEMPLWGIEQPDPPRYVKDIPQLWGLIAEDQAQAANLSTKRAAEMYLPGYQIVGGLGAGIPGYQYLPGLAGPKDALSAAYDIGTTSGTNVFDYTGATNLALFNRWQGLSRNETTAPKILHLIWTDIAANWMQGSKSWVSLTGNANSTLAKRDSLAKGNQGQTLVPVRVYRKQVQYHWLYAVPAVMAVGLFLVVLLGAVCLSMIRGGPGRIRHYLNHLSSGRLLAAEQYPGQAEKMAPTKIWLMQVGKNLVDIVQPYGVNVQFPYQSSVTPGSNPAYYGEKRESKVQAIALQPLNSNGQVTYANHMPIVR